MFEFIKKLFLLSNEKGNETVADDGEDIIIGVRSCTLGLGRILTIGGWNHTKMCAISDVKIGEIYKNTVTWYNLDPLPKPLAGHSLTHLANNEFLLIGGTNDAASFETASNSVKLGLVTGSVIDWYDLDNLPIKVFNHTTTLINNDLIHINSLGTDLYGSIEYGLNGCGNITWFYPETKTYT